MISTGIVRNIDELGRIVIPKELRKSMGLKDGTKEKKGTPLMVFQDGDSIVLKRYNPGCSCCNNMEDLKEINGIRLCKNCISKFSER